MLNSAGLPQSSFILPDWPAASNVVAFTSTRTGGFSTTPFSSLNLAQHVLDAPDTVEQNRALLPNHKNYFWLTQTHSTICLDLDQVDKTLSGTVEADACYSKQKKQVCAVMTADCLPILLCDKSAKTVAAVHAGWRGLANGVIENSVNKMNVAPKYLMAWMGPAISQKYFEVGQEVKQVFSQYPQAFKLNTNAAEEKYFVDLYQIAKQKLLALGIQDIYGGEYCTYANENQFFSHRRVTHQGHVEGEKVITTGRMVSAIYLD